MSDDRAWGWIQRYGERAHGKFATREKAVLDALSQDAEWPIEVGRCQDIEPLAYLPSLDDIIEQMECGVEGDCWIEEEAFSVSGTAGDALRSLLEAWATEHVTSSYWMLTDTEVVKRAPAPDLTLEAGNE